VTAATEPARNVVDLPAHTGRVAARTADSIGQATAVEQARAVAEVQAAIIVAQQCPRSITEAVSQMRESCQQPALAERAFFRYNRAGSQITGESIHLARELARCWGNIQYGIAELARDDSKGESELLAFAWDVQTNTRPTTTFIVKHGRDTKDGRKQLTELRDIYENNANMGARRVREQIFAVLPKWFVEEAKEVCRRTIEKGGDVPLSQRIASLVRSFGDLGVSSAQLEEHIGRKPDAWTAHDVAALTIIGRSIKNGEATIEDEFPQRRITAESISRRQDKRAKEPDSAPTDTAVDPDEQAISELNAEANEQAAEHDADTEPGGLFPVKRTELRRKSPLRSYKPGADPALPKNGPRLRRESPKRAKQMGVYRHQRLLFLAEHARCGFPLGCDQLATEIQHRCGRRGDRLLDVEWWAPSCHAHNQWAEEHTGEALAIGWLVRIEAAS
jgi:hypothetical protein